MSTVPDAQPKPTAAEVRDRVARALWIGEQETDETRDAAARYWDNADLTDAVIPRPYYRAQADRLATAGLLATPEHDAQVLRDAGLREVVSPHWCTPECPDGCDVAETARWFGEERVTEKREPLTADELADVQARLAHVCGARIEAGDPT